MSIEMIPTGTEIFCLSCGELASSSPFTAVADLPKHFNVNSPQQIIPQSETVDEDDTVWKVKHQTCNRCQHRVAENVKKAYDRHMSAVKQSTEEYLKAQVAKREAQEERERLETEKAFWEKQIEICPEILIRDNRIYYEEPDIVRGIAAGLYKQNNGRGSRKLIPQFVERSQFRYDQIRKQEKIKSDEKARYEGAIIRRGRNL